jgi:cyclic pyranopterin phosphate synthase
MSEQMTFLPRAQLLTLEELEILGSAFVELGVNKIRITGGEPLIRKGILQLFQNLSQLPALKELVLTTNGSQLEKMANSLREAGIKRLNISFDSLKAKRFQEITRNGKLEKVVRGIDAAIQTGFERIKINAVILKNRNHDEVVDLVQFAVDKGIDISFIEEMPVGVVNSHDREEGFYSSEQIRHDLSRFFTLLPTTETTNGPAKYYQIPNTTTRVGFISPHSHNFCDNCNRVRVTTEGRLILCLGQENSVDLRRVIRANPGSTEPLKQAIIEAMAYKPKGHDFDLAAQPSILRYMNVTGG